MLHGAFPFPRSSHPNKLFTAEKKFQQFTGTRYHFLALKGIYTLATDMTNHTLDYLSRFNLNKYQEKEQALSLRFPLCW